MLDIKFIRENKDLVKHAASKKHINFDVDALIAVDDQRLQSLQNCESLRATQNEANSKIASASSDFERDAMVNQMKKVKAELKKEEELLEQSQSKWRSLMLAVPNIPDMSVPDGLDDSSNIEIKVSGEKPVFNFTPRDHIQILEAQDFVDFERGTKVAGFRGYYLKGDAALLEMAIWQYVMQRWSALGYTPMIVPSLVKKAALFGTGYLPAGEDDLYKDGEDYLAGTGEVAAMYYHADEVLPSLSEPKKFIVWSPCFRKEIGSHGKDLKGLIRVHEFYKCEQVILCEASHELSVSLHEEIRNHSEELMTELGLPYHTVINCGGDLGQGQVKKYDIEGWVPSQNAYRETHSASYFHDFQTRRLGIRYKNSEGKTKHAHSLNNTAAATPRLLSVLVENYQEADGRIRVPERLIPFMGGKTHIGKSVF